MDAPPFYTALFAVGTTLAMLVLLRAGQRLFSPAKSVPRAFADGNAANRLQEVGQILAVFLVASATVENCVEGDDPARDALWTAVFGLSSLVLVVLFGRVGTRLLLKSRLPAEIERGNVAAGIAAAAHSVATGVILSHAFAGSDVKSLGLSFAFFLIAIATLLVFATLFRALTTYDDAEQIEGGNVAAALSYAGLTVAVAIIVARALDGTFEGWIVSLRGYGGVLLGLLALYPVRQLFVQTLLLGGGFSLRGGRLDVGIATDRNEGIGALEAASYVATGLAIARLA